MSENVIDRSELRRYLLGELNDEARLDFVEERLLVDDDFFNEYELVKEDLIDQYVRNELPPAEHASFEQHFLTTPERQEHVTHMQALTRFAGSNLPHVAAEAPVKKTSVKTDWSSRLRWLWSTPSPAWKYAFVLLLVVGLGFVTWRGFFYRSDLDQGLLALKTAYRLQRPVEPRVSGLEYAPLPNTRGSGSSGVDQIARERADRLLRYAETDKPGAASYRGLALLYLTELKFDQAIEQFKRALALDPKNAQLHSDLAAALLEKGKLDDQNGDQGKSVQEFAESLEHLNQALDLDPSLLDALFNRALCHQYMGLPQLAAEDWRKYLEKDSQSPWADEARKNLKLIESQPPKSSQTKETILPSFLQAYETRDDEKAWQVLSMNRDVTGTFVENELIDKYLALQQDGQTDEANKVLSALTYAEELESKRAKDRYLTDLLGFYKSARGQWQALIEARDLLKQGHKSLQTQNPEAAVDSYSKARAIFAQLGNETESLYAAYPTAHAYLLMHEPARSLSIFETIARDSEARQYRWLLSQSLGGVGNVQIGLNNYSAAVLSTTQAEEIAEQTGDIKGLMKLLDQLSNVYTRMGNYSKAIERQKQSLALVNQYPVDLLQGWRSNFLMAIPLHLLGFDAAAESFQKESLRIAKQSNVPYYLCRSYIGLGVIYGNQQKYDEAQKNVRLAFDLAKSINSEATRNDTIAYSSLQLGHLYRRAGDFNKAMESYEDVLKTFNDADYPAFIYAAHKGKLLSCLAQGGCPAADKEIEATLRLFENYRSRILEEENKFIFFDAEQNVYDAVIEYEYTINRNSLEAFDFSERSRARSLLGLATEPDSVEINSHHRNPRHSVAVQPLSAAEIAARMPAQSQLLQFSVLPQKILIWLINGSNVQAFEQKIDAGVLRGKAARFLHLLSSHASDDQKELKTISTEFYDLLIKPAESALDRNKQLCVVPDKVLNDLPYAAFISSSSGKYLVDEYVLTRAPSSTLSIVSSENARQRDTGTAETLLSVGNPRFDQASFPTLADLPSAKKEADEVARLYNSSSLLTGIKAVKSRVVAEMEKADVIHLALHAVIDEQSPLRSKLLFTKDASESSSGGDTLEIQEISKMRLPQTRLVVLSACQSAVGHYYDGEGMIGISRPFVANGVPLVVASLWAVDSDATAELMINFHRFRTSGKASTAEALTQAQRAMLNSSERRYQQPYYWAPFVTIGGYARF